MWIEVDGYENIPAGVWLTYHEARSHKDREVNVTTISNNGIGVSGGVFTFDLPRITHYMPLPELPV